MTSFGQPLAQLTWQIHVEQESHDAGTFSSSGKTRSVIAQAA
jgi:hypothetical protein